MSRRRSASALLALIAVLGLAPSGAARAQEIPRRSAEARDVWSEPNPGLRYLHRTTTTPCEVHALVVDLSREGVRLVATPHEARWSTVSEVARHRSLAAAVNGGFWGALQRPRGIAAGGGALWPDVAPDPEMGYFAIDARGRPLVRGPGEAVSERELASLREAVSGRPILLRGGEIAADALDSFPTANQRQPRTAAGVSEDGRRVVLVVVDGRRPTSRGMTLFELARLLAELGAHDAINLDGGGSSEMYVARAGGVVNVPSRGRWESALDQALEEGALGRDRRARPAEDGGEGVYVRGVEREVLNHLGVLAPDPVAVAPSAYDSALAGAPPIAPPTAPPLAPPRPPAIRLGALREVLAPAAVGMAAMLGVLAPALLGRRLVRRWRARCDSSARGGAARTTSRPTCRGSPRPEEPP